MKTMKMDQASASELEDFIHAAIDQLGAAHKLEYCSIVYSRNDGENTCNHRWLGGKKDAYRLIRLLKEQISFIKDDLNEETKD